MQRSHAEVCAQNHFQMIHLSQVAVFLTDIHGSKEDLELLRFFLKRIQSTRYINVYQVQHIWSMILLWFLKREAGRETTEEQK